MKLTNTKTKNEITTKSKGVVARNIGVSRQTVYNWAKKGVTQPYHHWILEFD